MPESEPNKKMDELLRAYAKKPRPAVELHPVPRRALQEEVKTVFGSGEARPKKAKFWPAWWVRWPIAAGFAAWAMLLVTNNRRFEMAQTQSRKEATWLAAEKTKDLKSEREPREEARSLAAAPMSPAPTAAPPSENPPASQAFISAENKGASFQNFAPAQQVLNNFQVQRDGERVLVTDGDGSVYSGNVVSAAAARARAKALADQNEGGDYSFAVKGTNRSLQQSVYFNGNVANAGNAQGYGGRNAAPTGQAQNGVRAQNGTQAQNAARAQGGAQAQNQARLSGTVTVGGTNQFRVEAEAPCAP